MAVFPRQRRKSVELKFHDKWKSSMEFGDPASSAKPRHVSYLVLVHNWYVPVHTTQPIDRWGMNFFGYGAVHVGSLSYLQFGEQSPTMTRKHVGEAFVVKCPCRIDWGIHVTNQWYVVPGRYTKKIQRPVQPCNL
jgi:hypothetical protein